MGCVPPERSHHIKTRINTDDSARQKVRRRSLNWKCGFRSDVSSCAVPAATHLGQSLLADDGEQVSLMIAKALQPGAGSQAIFFIFTSNPPSPLPPHLYH